MDRDCKVPTATFEMSDSLLGYHEGKVNHFNTVCFNRHAEKMGDHEACAAVESDDGKEWGGCEQVRDRGERERRRDKETQRQRAKD